jgi:hypothetical protein
MFAMFNEITHLDREFSQAEIALPAQFHDGRTDTATAEGLRYLMVAVLVDAIRCVQTKFAARQPSTREEFAEARSWIFANEDTQCSLSRRYATRWRSIRMLFGSVW